MGLISSIRVMTGMVSAFCFVLAIVFFGFTIASITLFPVMIFFLVLAALSISAGLYFREQK
jgi:uncharacterized membrane protein